MKMLMYINNALKKNQSGLTWSQIYYTLNFFQSALIWSSNLMHFEKKIQSALSLCAQFKAILIRDPLSHGLLSLISEICLKCAMQ